LERELLYKAATAALGTAATYLWGGFDAVFLALVVLACMDYVTGWAAGVAPPVIPCKSGRRGR
jgi:phage-related holin